MVLHAEVDRDMPYPGTGGKMSKSVHIAGRVLGYGWERRSRSKKRTKVPWYISTYNVGGPNLRKILSKFEFKERYLSTPGPTLGTLYVPKGFLCTKSGSGHTSSCHIFCHASHEDHKHNKKYHRDHGSRCPTSSMQRHYHISATAGPNPLKINDDKVDSLFYNSF